MQYLSLNFVLLFIPMLVLYWSIPRRGFQNAVLMVASVLFVGAAGPWAIAVFVVSSALEWLIARSIGRSASKGWRTRLLWGSVVVNIAQLAFFKYSDFFVPQATALLGVFGLAPGAIHLIMPAGLSFWTLQKMTLTLDVYLGRMKPEPSLFRAVLFTGFFPSFMSGPIERARNLLPQFDKARTMDSRRFAEAVWLFAIGAFQKAVLADHVGECVDELLGPNASGVSVLLGLWAYAIQIFCDFSGYSDMARGVARFLGFEVTQNFMAPYFASNISEYWKRWHVSLSSWLNDYVFNPSSLWLRDWGTASIVASTWITFLISGLWHGTGWTFVAWGSLHAIGLTIFALTKNIRKQAKKKWGHGFWLHPLMALVTFHWICLGYLFFRAHSLGAAFEQMGALARGNWNPMAVQFSRLELLFTAVGMLSLHWAVYKWKNVFWIFDRSLWFRVVVYIALGYLLTRFYAPAVRYIYFQF